MTDLRAAAQQALEYMKSVGQIDMYPEEWAIVGRLEAALEQEQAEPVQEPVAWRITDGEGDWEYRTDLPEDWSIQWSARYGRKYEPLYTAPLQRKENNDE